jgi:predicted ATPase
VRDDAVKLTRPLGQLKIPLTVQAILAARIDRLPPAEKELLQALAVIGRDLPSELVKVITNKGEEQVEALLADLQLGEFIYEVPSVVGAEYTFKHALTQEVAVTNRTASAASILALSGMAPRTSNQLKTTLGLAHAF